MTCPACGFAGNPDGARFCSACGAAQAPTPAGLAGDGERRRLTLMFCDLVDSTPLAESMDPEELRALLRSYQSACTGVIEEYEGYIAKWLGDGLLVLFGYPHAHEDDAIRAVEAAVRITEAVTRLDESGKLSARAGVHTGLVVVTGMGAGQWRQDVDVVGEAPNIAARLQALAAPGQVVVSGATNELLGGRFQLVDLGQPALKGVSRGVHAYGVESHGDAGFGAAVREARRTPLLGREREYDALVAAWAETVRGARGALLVSGDPGIGKTRLLRALRDHVRGEGGAWLEMRCSALHQNTALYPVSAEVRGIVDAWPDPWTGLDRLFNEEGVPLAAIPLLASHLGIEVPAGRYPPPPISPEVRLDLVMEAYRALLGAEAGGKPLVVVCEDLHWADASTAAFLASLPAAQEAGRSLLLLGTSRGDPQHQSTAWTQHINLEPLDQASVRRLAETAAGLSLPQAMLDLICARTDGVPLFVEELARALSESQGDLPSRIIPSTLYDLLMARLDQLGPAREIAQVAAALGRSFTYPVLSAVTGLDDEALLAGLSRLVASGIIFPLADAGQHQREYVFKHALIQDAAYDSVLRATRQNWHRRCAEVLSGATIGIPPAEPEVLARHFARAGMAEEAIDGYQRAGREALRRGASTEASRHFADAVRLLERMPAGPDRDERLLAAQLAQTGALTQVQGFTAPEVRDGLERALAISAAVGPSAGLTRALDGLFLSYVNLPDIPRSLAVAERLQATSPGVLAALDLSIAHYCMAEIGRAEQHAAEAIDFVRADPEGSGDTAPFALGTAAVVFQASGRSDRALALLAEAMALTEHRPLPVRLPAALITACQVHALSRDAHALKRSASALRELGDEHGFLHWKAIAQMFEAAGSLFQGGVDDDAESGFRAGLAGSVRAGNRAWVATYASILAGHLATAHRFDAALSMVADAAALAGESGLVTFRSEWLRIEGEVFAETRTPAEAEERFRAAVDFAAAHGLRLFELRSQASLCRFLASRGEVLHGDRQRLTILLDEVAADGLCFDAETTRGILSDLR